MISRRSFCSRIALGPVIGPLPRSGFCAASPQAALPRGSGSGQRDDVVEAILCLANLRRVGVMFGIAASFRLLTVVPSIAMLRATEMLPRAGRGTPGYRNRISSRPPHKTNSHFLYPLVYRKTCMEATLILLKILRKSRVVAGTETRPKRRRGSRSCPEPPHRLTATLRCLWDLLHYLDRVLQSSNRLIRGGLCNLTRKAV